MIRVKSANPGEGIGDGIVWLSNLLELASYDIIEQKWQLRIRLWIDCGIRCEKRERKRTKIWTGASTLSKLRGRRESLRQVVRVEGSQC